MGTIGINHIVMALLGVILFGLFIYIVARLIAYAATKSYFQAKHEYNNNLNNKENSNGEEA